VAAFLTSLPPTLETVEIAEMRQLGLEAMLRYAGDSEPIASVQDVDAGGVSARLYDASDSEERNVLLWFHGGGWFAGSIEASDHVCRALANAAGCTVLSVEYRLAPEHPYPAAVDDCWAATEWALARFRQLAVGGDSSGGNLAAAIALRSRDYDVPLSLQILVYPVLDYGAVDGAFFREYIERYVDFIGGSGIEHQARIRWIWEQYVPDSGRRLDPEASPLRAKTVAGVAPALIITAEHDILRGECQDYARRLVIEGVPVELLNYQGQIHGFFALPGVMDEGQDAINKVGVALRRAFST
jgi:acetyl esterase